MTMMDVQITFLLIISADVHTSDKPGKKLFGELTIVLLMIILLLMILLLLLLIMRNAR